MRKRKTVLLAAGALALLVAGCTTNPEPKTDSSASDQARTVNRAALGANTRQPTSDDVRAFELTRLVGRAHGQYISAVDQGGPAEQAGLQAGDVLLALDANKIYSQDDIEDFLRVSQLGSTVKVVLKRAGTHEEETVTVTLAGTQVEDQGRQFAWQYAGVGQLDAALAAAKQEGTLVIVGLSGSDTC